MPQNRIDQMFSELQTAAFMPFLTVGDPNLETTEAIICEAEKQGADMLELGVPFSDPIADGSTIQASYVRALDNGFRVQGLFDMVKRVRGKGVKLPLVCMVSHSIVYRKGLDTFLQSAKEAGFDGILMPDLPSGYEGEAREKAAALDLKLIFLCAPTTPAERRETIGQHSTGFVYYISVTGITGERTQLPPDLEQNLIDLKERSKVPVCVGFGISKPEQAAAVAKFANGVIVGSALVRQTAELVKNGADLKEIRETVGEQIRALAQATHGGR